MSFYDVSSVDASAERYMRILNMAPQARRRDADCTLLLCVATRLFAGHVDWLRDLIEPARAKLQGDGFATLHRLWNGPFIDQAQPWDGLPSRMSWIAGVQKSSLQRREWAEELFQGATAGACPLKKWGEVAGHFRNALSHGGVRWIRDGRPRVEAIGSSGTELTLEIRGAPRSIEGLVMLSKEQHDGTTFRACRISTADFEELLFRWLRAIKASGIRASADEVGAALCQAS